jgi:hypothetical protein
MFYQIDKVLVNTDVVSSKFACDLSQCKGGCCTFEGDYGAPLQPSEIELLRASVPLIIDMIPEDHRKVIESSGFFENIDDELFTKSYNRRACVFVYYDCDIAKCSLEKVYYEGKTDFIKPISCHLFPIRISAFGGDILRYERFGDCLPAVEKGQNEKVRLVSFLEDPLVRKYGRKWYNALEGLND